VVVQMVHACMCMPSDDEGSDENDDQIKSNQM